MKPRLSNLYLLNMDIKTTEDNGNLGSGLWQSKISDRLNQLMYTKQKCRNKILYLYGKIGSPPSGIGYLFSPLG
jgi:hypothetical protein